MLKKDPMDEKFKYPDDHRTTMFAAGELGEGKESPEGYSEGEAL